MTVRVNSTLGALNAASATFTNDGGPFYFSTVGTFTGTLTLQYTPDGGANWVTVRNDNNADITLAGARRQIIWDLEVGGQFRVQMTAYTSGSAVVRLNQ